MRGFESPGPQPSLGSVRLCVVERRSNDPGVLADRPRDRFFLLRCVLYANGGFYVVLWAVTLYLLAFAFSSSAAAAPCEERMIKGDQTDAGNLCASIRGDSCSSGTTSTFAGTPANTWTFYCGAPSFPSELTAWAVSTWASGGGSCGGTDLPDCDNILVTAVSACPAPLVEDVSGGYTYCLDEEDLPDPCSAASADNHFTSGQTSTNPGLCTIGDEIDKADFVCLFSATAGRNCNATVSESVLWQSVLPQTFVTTFDISFGSTSCETATSPTGFDWPECDQAPHTCPAGFHAVFASEQWSCAPNSDDPIPDSHPPPQTVTNTYTSTTTSTTTTTDLGGGVTQTVTESVTEFGECPEGESCTQTLDFEGPGDQLGPVKSFGEIMQAFWDSIMDTELFLALSAIAGKFSGDPACPTWSGQIGLVDQNFVVDGHCTAIEPITSEIRWIFLAVWSLTALFIILSA